jgi:hypothetical protein
MFIDLPPELSRAAGYIEDEKWAMAFAAIKKSNNQDDHFAKTLVNKINSNVEAHISLIKKQGSAGDIYSVFTNFQKHSKSYKGIPVYDELFKQYGDFFKKVENKEELKLGREFHSIIDRMNQMRSASKTGLDVLEKYAKDHAETVHGKAAQKAFEKISDDLEIKLPAEAYYKE